MRIKRKRIIFIFAFVAMIAGAFFYYNNRIMADDKDSKCTSCECKKSASCSKESIMESKSMNGQKGGEMNECSCTMGKCDVKKQSSSCLIRPAVNTCMKERRNQVHALLR